MFQELLHPSCVSTYQKIWNVLKASRRILLIAHPKPDGDTTGSSLAMYQMLRRLPQTEVVLFCQDSPGANLQFLPFADHIQTDPNLLIHPYDVTTIFDSGDLEYVGLPKLLTPKQLEQHELINIDHHASNVFFGKWNLVQTAASSTCELVLDLFNANQLEIDKNIASCLLTGLITDTGAFSNLATTPGSLRAAGMLLRYGASVSKITHQTVKNQSLGRLKLWGRALSRLHRDPKTRVVTTVIRRSDLDECEASPDEIDGIANFLNELEDADIVLVYQERENGMLKGSLRTTKALIDVSKIAKMVGGGGHVKAAGFMIPGELVQSSSGWKVKAPTTSPSPSHLIFI